MEWQENKKPELESLLEFLIFYFSIWKRNYSYGQELQNLTYEFLSYPRKMIFGILKILIPYFLNRWFLFYTFLHSKLSSNPIPERPSFFMTKFVHSLERLYNLFSTINLIVFLWDGAFVNLLLRILNIRQTYKNPQMSRTLMFDYMDRQLIWDGFTEFMLYMVPIMPTHNIVGKITKFFKLKTGKNNNDGKCPICESTINTPYETNCGHYYCYYCLKVATMTDSKFTCLVCNQIVHNIERKKVK